MADKKFTTETDSSRIDHQRRMLALAVWTTPVVTSVILPVHAETSATTPAPELRRYSLIQTENGPTTVSIQLVLIETSPGTFDFYMLITETSEDCVLEALYTASGVGEGQQSNLTVVEDCINDMVDPGIVDIISVTDLEANLGAVISAFRLNRDDSAGPLSIGSCPVCEIN